MSTVLDKLRSRRFTSSPEPEIKPAETDLFRAAVGEAHPLAEVRRDGPRLLTEEEAHQMLGRPLSEAQRAGYEVLAQLGRGTV